ncbi:MAG: TetR/AcrR family transcriptional regulator [Sphingomonadaceae bacterium]
MHRMLNDPVALDAPIPPKDGIRARRRAQLIENLHQIAIHLYLERGYDGTSVQDICDEAGISRRTFFRHFHGKDAALSHGVEVLAEAIAERFSARPSTESIIDSFLAAVEEALAQAVAEPDKAILRLRLMQDVPGLRAQFLSIGSHQLDRLDAEIARRLGRMVEDPRVSLFRSFVTAAIVRVFLAWSEAGGGDQLHDLASEFLAVLKPVEQSLTISGTSSPA